MRRILSLQVHPPDLQMGAPTPPSPPCTSMIVGKEGSPKTKGTTPSTPPKRMQSKLPCGSWILRIRGPNSLPVLHSTDRQKRQVAAAPRVLLHRRKGLLVHLSRAKIPTDAGLLAEEANENMRRGRGRVLFLAGVHPLPGGKYAKSEPGPSPCPLNGAP